MTQKENIIRLENVYRAQQSAAAVVYGMPRAGLKEFLFDFLKDKEYFYYKAVPCDLPLQFNFITKQLAESFKYSLTNVKDFNKVLKSYVNSSENKKVIVLDDFTHLSKGNKTFLNFILSLLRNQPNILFILSTEDTNFIENEMPSYFGKAVYELNCLIKVEAGSFLEISSKYKNMDFAELSSVYACLGGNRELWNYYKNGVSCKDFIINELLGTNGLCARLKDSLLPSDLREKSVYNTLLYILSDGNVKLNDIHEKSGYDRAKISVYLKNLSDRGIVRKAESFAALKNSNIKKGIYTICDPFISFWYKFIFPNISMLEIISPERFYRKFIESGFNAYRETVFVDIVRECLDLQLKKDGLNIGANSFGRFLDKNDAIDIAGTTTDGSIILCACHINRPHMPYRRFEELIESAAKSKIKYDYILLASAVDFDQKLHLYSSVHDNIKLISKFV